MHVDVHREVSGPLADAAWRFYREVFDDLRFQAIERHLYEREVFDDLMTDTRIPKFVALDGDELVGLAAQTNDLAALSDLSLDFFSHRWPQHFAEQRIFYAVFVGARPGRRGVGVFVSLLRRMMEPILEVDGMVMVDICTHNERELDLPTGIARVLRRIAGEVRPTRVDSQSYWLYEFPDAS